MPNQKVTYCVHGASSLIGSNFCRKLMSMGMTFTVFARKSSNLDFLLGYEEATVYRYSNSISELKGRVPQMSGAVFIELTWQGVFGDEKNNDTQITFNIPHIIDSISFARTVGVGHWIGLGSQAEYGPIDGTIDENHPCHPITLYGKAKFLASSLSAVLCEHYGIGYSWLRLFSAYGPYSPHQWFIDYLIKEMKEGNEINLTECEQYLDYLHVDDISRLFLKLGETNGIGVANLGSGNATQLKDIVQKLHRMLGSKSTLHYGALDYKPDQSMFNEANIAKLSGLLDWKPFVNLDDGLRDMIDKMAAHD